MRTTLLRTAALVAVAAIALVAATAATAKNWPLATLDQVATEVAGKPVAVYCEDDARPWDELAYGALGIPGEWLNGFTFPDEPVVYLSPHQCERLHMAIEVGYRDAGLGYATSALLTLAHEAMHQRNPALNESQTDCAAMPLVVPLAVKYLRVPATINVPRTVSSWKRVGKKRVRVSTVVHQSVTNPELARIAEWTSAYHRAKPAEYQGAC